MGMGKQMLGEQVFAVSPETMGHREDSGLQALLSSPGHIWPYSLQLSLPIVLFLGQVLYLNVF